MNPYSFMDLSPVNYVLEVSVSYVYDALLVSFFSVQFKYASAGPINTKGDASQTFLHDETESKSNCAVQLLPLKLLSFSTRCQCTM